MALLEECEQQGQWLFKYRGIIPIFILAIGTFLYLRTELYPETFFLEETPYEIYYEYTCILISLVGLAIRIYAVGHTPKNTSGRNVDGQLAETLNTSGIYSAVRHPLYLGNFFMWLGPAMYCGQFWFIISFCLFYWVYYERIMFAEEQYLKRKFGKAYEDWSASVPAFWPSFSNFRSPELPFSIKKVLKKEKNGFVALFGIYFFFNLTGEILEKDQAHFDYIIGATFIISFILYFVLKYLKHNTKMLEEIGR